ncbi:DHA2 family efflux MFS transporter permease subunit [Candidatus Binatus sp.]|jgi:DHA2 family multidrug resistance protein|uniref:DHA2 family efflux MFS transporter permease subunit n=1 Tax=Candidatus Binatus sp. TaxID=2811406 RepID=UPI002FDABCA3
MAATPKPLVLPTHEVYEFSSTRKWVIAVSVMLCTVLEVLDSSIVNVSLPHMQGSFSASVDEIAWVVTSYLVAAGIMIPMTGWIAERFGRKRYFVASIAMFIVASALCGVAQSLNQIVFFRLLQGAAGAAMMPLSQAILMETFPPREQAMAMAVWGIGIMVAPIMGPTIGGYITDAWTWRWNFYINVPIGTLAAFMVYRFVDDPSYMRNLRRARIDFLGITCLFVALGLGEIVLDRGERADWFQSGWVVYCTAAALISLAVLIYHELHTEDPVIDLSILENMSFTLPVTLVIFLTFTLYGTAILNPVFLQETLGFTASRAGLVMAPRGFGTMFSMILLGTIARRGGDIRPLVGIGFILVAFAMWEMSGLNLASDVKRIVWPTVVQGVGTGLIFPSLSAAAFISMEKFKIGRAASLYSVTRNLGAAIGTSYLTTLLIRREQVNQSYLVEHITVFTLPHMQMPGGLNMGHEFAMGHKHGMMMLYGMVQRQAMMLSFNDIYRMLCMLMLVLVPTFLFLKRNTRNLPAQAGH